MNKQTSIWLEDLYKDPAYRSVSAGARGLWVDILYLCSISPEKGVLLKKNSKPYNDSELSRICGIPENEIQVLKNELIEAEVSSLTENGIIYNRRMVREERKKVLATERKRKERAKSKKSDTKTGVRHERDIERDILRHGRDMVESDKTHLTQEDSENTLSHDDVTHDSHDEKNSISNLKNKENCEDVVLVSRDVTSPTRARLSFSHSSFKKLNKKENKERDNNKNTEQASNEYSCHNPMVANRKNDTGRIMSLFKNIVYDNTVAFGHKDAELYLDLHDEMGYDNFRKMIVEMKRNNRSITLITAWNFYKESKRSNSEKIEKPTYEDTEEEINYLCDWVNKFSDFEQWLKNEKNIILYQIVDSDGLESIKNLMVKSVYLEYCKLSEDENVNHC